MYQEVLDCHMRPFADGTQVFPRIVRDLGTPLGKTVTLQLTGESATVNRDIIEHIKAPIFFAMPSIMASSCRTSVCVWANPRKERSVLEAAHSAGKLLVTVADNGRGIELGAIRDIVVKRNFTTPDTAQKNERCGAISFFSFPDSR
jgi:two-component system, chemotaxis family, sensor histidine kinase and response regulator WspE